MITASGLFRVCGCRVRAGRVRAGRARSRLGPRRPGYMLLEVVIATGLLLLGLVAIGSQVQAAQESVRKMRFRLQALRLAESHFAMMDLGLVELDSVDDEQEDEFGERFPDFGWRLTTDETATEGLFLLTLEILYQPRDDVDEEFDFDEAERILTLRAMRPAPKPLDLGAEFGLTEEEIEDLAEQLSGLNIEGLSVDSFDPRILARLDFEELIEVLPPLLATFNIPIDQILGSLPPEALQALEESGLLEDLLGGVGSGEGAGEEGEP